MKKPSKILQLAELFYKQAFRSLAAEPQTWTMPDDDEESDTDLTGNVDIDYDNIDIKFNENFSNLLDDLVEQYHAVMNALDAKVSNLTDESIADAMELYKTFARKYEKAITHPYLDSPKFLTDEDVSPVTVTQFITNMGNEVEQRIDSLEEDDFSLEEAIREGIPEEFNVSPQLAGNPAAEQWVANKFQQKKEVRQENMRKLRQDPKRFAKYLENRRAYAAEFLKMLKQDPEKYQQFRAKENKRLENAFEKRTTDIKNLWLVYNSNSAKIGLLPHGAERNKLIYENQRIKKQMESISKKLARTEESSFHVSREKHTEKRKNLKGSNTLEGDNLILKQKTQSAKSEIKKKLLTKVDSVPNIIELRKKIAANFLNYKENSTPENKSRLEHLQKLEKELMNAEVNKNPIFIKATADTDKIEMFRKEVDKLVKMKKEYQGNIPVGGLVEQGELLLTEYSEFKEYKTVMDALNNVLEKLRTL